MAVKKMKVLIADKIAQKGIDYLSSNGLEVDLLTDESRPRLVEMIPDYDAIIVRSATQVTAELISAGTNLKVIGRAGVGLDNIDQVAAKEHNIAVVNAPEGPSQTVAEAALALLLAVAREIPRLDAGVKSGKWLKKSAKGVQLGGTTLGIIGTGQIGANLLRFALAIGMKVVGYDIIIYDELVKLENFRYVETLDELYAEADVISLHVPLIPPTKHMLNEEAFNKMKDGVIILNCARGGIIDEKALVKALDSGKVRGAGLDVFESEPN
ncbi:MAG: hydroxyacid dehydrogenase, partial [Candidatus Heimdallarchaeota archaeon]|nr:hydroxyacid dehydrogenase [Candidatus Heimdallarchaeota archaeon]MCK5047927.1 hydroxyacid dehydrogenase [Candidatus Heimdallarchaeota archaeon]